MVDGDFYLNKDNEENNQAVLEKDSHEAHGIVIHPPNGGG